MGRIRINPPAKKLNPQLYTRVTQGDTRHYGSGMIQETPQQFRVGAARLEPDSPPQKSYYVPWDIHHAIALSKTEYDEAIAHRAERQQAAERAEQKRKNQLLEAERVRLAHEVDDQRRAEVAAEEHRLKEVERNRQSVVVETQLLADSIKQFFQAYAVTPAEQQALNSLARSQGLLTCVDLYPDFLSVVRREKKDALGEPASPLGRR